MGTDLKTKVEQALRQACEDDPDAKIELEDVQPGKVSGLLLSGSFADLSPKERQDKIWERLDLSLSPFERTQIVFIVTDTPEEYEKLKYA